MTAPIAPHERNKLGRLLLTWRTRLVAAAGAWSVLTVVIGTLWAVDIVASPFGANDPRKGEVGSYLEGLTPQQTGLVAVAIGLVGIALAVLLRLAPARRWPAVPAVLLGLLLLVVVPDARVIQNFAYLFFAYTGLWEGALAAQIVAIAGGLLWMAAAAAQLEAGAAGSPVPHEPRWGRAATYTAAALAMPYPAVRVAWALGIPLGTRSDYLDDFTSLERLGVGLVFGGLPTIGALLTIGLIRRWGETFPRWIPLLRGRRVPIWFAVIPGVLAAVMIMQMGLRTTVWTARGIVLGDMEWDSWGAWLPGLFILPWGLALTAAVYAYAVRRLHHDAGAMSAAVSGP